MVRVCGLLSRSRRTVGVSVVTPAFSSALHRARPNYRTRGHAIARRSGTLTVSFPGARRRSARTAGDRPAQDPRHLHLGDADLLGDLRLGQVLDEAQRQHLALALRELTRGGARPSPGRRPACSAGSSSPNVSTTMPPSPSPSSCGASSEDAWWARAVSSDSSTSSTLSSRYSASSWHRGRPPRLRAQPLLRLLDLDRPLLRTTGHVHRPAEVAEVALELAQDRRHRERRERRAPAAVIPVHGLDQTQARHLQQIVERLAGAAVASGQLASQGQETLNQLLASAAVIAAAASGTNSDSVSGGSRAGAAG